MRDASQFRGGLECKAVPTYHQNQMELGKHSDCQRSPKARASLLARSWVQLRWDLSLQAASSPPHRHVRKACLA